jgi:hypothetical protein
VAITAVSVTVALMPASDPTPARPVAAATLSPQPSVTPTPPRGPLLDTPPRPDPSGSKATNGLDRSTRSANEPVEVGTERTLYAPGPVTRKNGNKLIILELGATAGGAVEFVSGPDPGPTGY